MSTKDDTRAQPPPPWWRDVFLALRGRRLTISGRLPTALADALQAEPPATGDPLAVWGGDQLLDDADAAFTSLAPGRVVLVCTPEDQRAESECWPRLDEWVGWLAQRGLFRDFRRDAVEAPGCVSLRADATIADVVAAYQRNLEQRGRAAEVHRAVAEGYRADLRLRELEIEFLHEHLSIYLQKAHGDDLSADLLTAIRNLATIRRRMAPLTSLRTRTFDWSVARIVALEERVMRSFDARDALLATVRGWTARMRANGRG